MTLSATPLGLVDRSSGSVHLERRLSADPTLVWEALTDPGRRDRWLRDVVWGSPGPDAVFTAVGNDDPGRVTCTVVNADEPHQVELTWDDPEQGPSRVRLTVVTTDQGTKLVVDHDQLPGDAAKYGARWHAYLDALEAVLNNSEAPAFAERLAELEAAYAAAATG